MTISQTDYVKCNLDIMTAYCDTAKSYVQIASVGIAAPFLFLQVIHGKNAADAGLAVSRALLISWLCFLTTVAAGLVYQWLAIRLAANLLDGVEARFSRSIPYGVMVASFFAGACAFVVFAANQLGVKI